MAAHRRDSGVKKDLFIGFDHILGITAGKIRRMQTAQRLISGGVGCHPVGVEPRMKCQPRPVRLGYHETQGVKITQAAPLHPGVPAGIRRMTGGIKGIAVCPQLKKYRRPPAAGNIGDHGAIGALELFHAVTCGEIHVVHRGYPHPAEFTGTGGMIQQIYITAHSGSVRHRSALFIPHYFSMSSQHHHHHCQQSKKWFQVGYHIFLRRNFFPSLPLPLSLRRGKNSVLPAWSYPWGHTSINGASTSPAAA